MRVRVKVVKLAGRDHLALRWNDPVTGFQRQRSAGTANRQKANRKAADLEAELARSDSDASGDMPWSEFRLRFENEQAPNLARKTIGVVATAMNHVESMVNPRRLGDITPSLLSTLQARMRSAGMAETTIAGYFAHFTSALSWAKSMNFIAVVPKLKRPRRAKRADSFARGRAITDDEFASMIAAVAEIRPDDAECWKRLLTGLWLSGLRLGESLILTWENFGEFSICLDGRHPMFRIEAEYEKGKRDRLLPMTPDFAKFLLATQKAERTGFVFHIPSIRSPQLSEKKVSNIISELGKQAKVLVNIKQGKHASAQDLRRTFGTRWAVRVMPAVLQKLMRHASIETTMKYYVGINSDALADSLWRDWSDAKSETIG